MHSCFTSSIFATRTLDFKVKFGFVFRSEAVVFRRYVLALLSVGLLRKFEPYLVYLSLIRSYFPRCFSFFQKFLHFTYMLLWFRLIIPRFPAQIDDMRSRFSALSRPRSWTALLQRMLLSVLADRNLSPLRLAHFFTLILLSFIEPTLLDTTRSFTREISIVKSYKVCFSFVLDYLDDGKITKN